MDLQLEGDGVVVVGGASGIGRAIASAFAAADAAVVVFDRDPLVTATATEIAASTGAGTRAIIGDATDYAAVQDVARQATQELGAVHHVVYAAGAGSGRYGFPFWKLAPVDWDRVLRVNLMGAVHTAHAFAPELAAQGRGTMLFIVSVAGQIGSQTDPPYSAAKAGLINFSQCAAKDLGPFGVRVNAISPGMIQTALNRSVWQAWHDEQPAAQRLSYEQWADAKVKRVCALGRWQRCEDVASLAVFLASSHAENITGQTLNVDGGQVMHA